MIKNINNPYIHGSSYLSYQDPDTHGNEGVFSQHPLNC